LKEYALKNKVTLMEMKFKKRKKDPAAGLLDASE
jgi:hypothetical protein